MKLKFINYDAEDGANRFIESPDEFDNVGIYLGGKGSGIVAIGFTNVKDNNCCETRVIEAILEKDPCVLIVRRDDGYVLLYKTDRELDDLYDGFINIGIEAKFLTGESNVVIKTDGVMREILGELSFDNLTTVPDALLPLKDYDVKNLGGLYDDSRNSSLFSHLYSVRTNYNDIDLKDIAFFINKNVYDEPLDQSEIDRIVKGVIKTFNSNKGYKSLSEYEQKEIEWLYYPYIPLSAITILAGDPGCGKSQIAVLLSSIISKGESFPFSDEINIKSSVNNPSFVIIHSAEDGIETGLKYRFSKYDANQDYILVKDDDSDELFMLDNPNCLEQLEKTLKDFNPKLIVFDTAQRYMGKININDIIDVTDCLKPLTKLAQKYSCAVLMIHHLNKSVSFKNLYRIPGSVGITGIARSVLVVHDLENDEEEKALIHVKSNSAKEGLPIIFEITEDGIAFKERRYLKSQGRKPSKLDIAKAFIKELLSKGEVEGTVLTAMAKEADIAKSTLDKAKEELGVVSKQKEKNRWFCRLPEKNDTSITQDSNHKDLNI